jgi:hypothetical protein
LNGKDRIISGFLELMMGLLFGFAVFNIYSHLFYFVGAHDFRFAPIQTCPTEKVVQAGIQIETDEGGSRTQKK